jgi:fumarylacetoacetase
MDFELEMATVIGQNTILGQRIRVDQAEEYAFGMLLFNDWSARDIQKWEYVPLGPFLGKNFGSTVSPWIVTMEALAPFKTAASKQEPAVLSYLQEKERANYDIELSVGLRPKDGDETIISRSNYKYMYWSINQQIAHHTVNGCNVKIGDLMASGTISGPTADSFGSMLELSWAGSKTIKLNNGEERKFIEDHDTISLYGFGKKEHIRVGFGRASGTILPPLI